MVTKATATKRAGRAKASAPSKRTAAKKTATKKAPARKTTKKAAAKKIAAKKVAAKKAAAKKTAAKKTAAKKPAPKKAARAKSSRPAKPASKASSSAPVVIDVEALVYRLIGAAAERDLSVVYGALSGAALDAIATSIVPEFGTVQFTPPPSYRRFMAAFGSLRVLDADGEVAGFCVYTPGEVAEQTRDFVHVPDGVGWEDDDGRECTLTTNHLIAFADAGGEVRWCFDTDAPGPGGELPVCLHHQDEPQHARSRETGAQVTARAHDYPDFMSWLIGQVDNFCEPPRASRRRR